MKVEIWSDVMCPFCYIGKRRFEEALAEFAYPKDVDIEWKSFQLNPQMKTEPDKNINQYLAEIKGWSMEEAKQMNDRVTGMASEVGLEYNFDKAVVANSYDAHRLLQLAKQYGKGDMAEEALFRTYFTEGGNLADHNTLKKIGQELGLETLEVAETLDGNRFAEAVELDVYQAQQLGIRGVPFFVLNEKYGISGAQPKDVFKQALDRSFSEWQQQLPITNLNSDGEACNIDGKCD